ncbi:hypothetical protein NQ176_g1061 [Zarea fungicola]|uniref:Uncharacterized protein n=1 Tax=Zarea fungicola TaxID=93591 RepID=A0ACC1NVG3_9HYPO|nr:hypothetical protein NQ176_g1061 [Lecanicillium fungicola]
MDSQNKQNSIAAAVPAQTSQPNSTAPSEVLKSFEGFLSFILAISIFGASTFATIVSEIAEPNHSIARPHLTTGTIRALLGVAWLLFVLALGVVALSMSLLAYQREHPAARFDGPWKGTWERLGIFAASLIQLLVIAAFVLLSIVLVAYTRTVGWVAVAMTSIAAAFTLVSLMVQWL